MKKTFLEIARRIGPDVIIYAIEYFNKMLKNLNIMEKHTSKYMLEKTTSVDLFIRFT